MLERDEAEPYLQRLAQPTMDAFVEARTHYTALQEAMREIRARFAAPVAAITDGVNYWAMFASFLVEQFERIPGVERLPSHPFSHHFLVDGELVLQLKSDTGNLPTEQLVIEGMGETRHASMEYVVLTWDHDHTARFDPAFVQLERSREVWRIPVQAFIDADVHVVHPDTPRATVSSARESAAQNTGSTSP